MDDRAGPATLRALAGANLGRAVDWLRGGPNRTLKVVYRGVLYTAASVAGLLLLLSQCSTGGGGTLPTPTRTPLPTLTPTTEMVAVPCTATPATTATGTLPPTATSTPSATWTPTSTPSPLPTATSTPTIPLIPSPTPRPTPAYDETVLDTLTRIAYIEAGAGPYIRPSDDKTFSRAVQSIAWIARNWIEVGDPGEDDQGHKWVHREESYQDTYKHFDAYNSGKYQEITKDSPGYDLVYAEVKKVLSGQVSDWTGGALYNLSYDAYNNGGYKPGQELSSSVVWERKAPNSDKVFHFAVYLFKEQPQR